MEFLFLSRPSRVLYLFHRNAALSHNSIFRWKFSSNCPFIKFLLTITRKFRRVVDGREELNHGKKTLPATSTFFEAIDLQLHVEYQFWVTGSTRVGEGQSSRVAAQVPSSRVAAKITSFGGYVVRPWRGSATLACNAVGDLTREWYKGTEQIHTDSARNVQILTTGELVLSNLQSQDSGNYTCHVENAHGNDKLHYTLTVQGNFCVGQMRPFIPQENNNAARTCCRDGKTITPTNLFAILI